MKKIILIYINLILFGGSLLLESNNFNYIVQTVDFSGMNREKIFTIFCEIDCTSTFILPENELIAEIIEPTENWTISSDNKRFIYVVPDKQGVHTSLDIITKGSHIYSFILKEVSFNPGVKDIGKQILIINKKRYLSKFNKAGNTDPFSGINSTNSGFRKKSDGRRIYSRYKIRDKYFFLKRVEDDGIFTYLDMKKSQLRPAVFLRKKRKNSRLEPVRYFDTGKYYQIHRVINKKELLILKLGKMESEIRRK
ncbi:MAG: TrbG/VirB9 family P-type conjugative transfer protein [Acidobacteriota bacterium]